MATMEHGDGPHMDTPLIQRIVAVLFSTGLLVLIVQLIRTRRLREEYALIWLAAGVTIFVLSVFGGLVNRLAGLLRVSYPPTLILVAGLLFALMILLLQSVAISTQADRLRDLAQYVALLEQRTNPGNELHELNEAGTEASSHVAPPLPAGPGGRRDREAGNELHEDGKHPFV